MKMKVENVEYPSKLGRAVSYTYRYHEDPTEVLTVILPGQAYYKDAPLMWYSAISAFEAGSDALNVEYSFHANRSNSEEALSISIEELASTLKEFLETHIYSKLVFVSKSIGTIIAKELCSKYFTNVNNHIFQTPLKPTIQFMKESKNMLVLVGDNDPAFGKEDIFEIDGKDNLRVVVFHNANHLLEVADNFEKSIEYLQKVAAETYSFIRKITTS